MTEIPYRELLKEGGCVRAALKATLQWGDWADVFCDGILSEMDKTHLEDFVLTYGAQAANVCPTGSGGVQLNIAWKERGSWAVHIGESFDDAVNKMWLQKAMVDRIMNERTNEPTPDKGNAGDPGALEILPWSG